MQLRHTSPLLVKLKSVQLLPMMMLLQVAQFMQQHVVNAVHRCLDEPGIGRDQTGTAAAPPACPHRSHGQGWAWNAQSRNARRTHCETLVEHLPGFLAIPPLKNALDTLGVVLIGYRDVHKTSLLLDILRLTFEHFQALLAAKVAVTLTAHIGPWRLPYDSR